MKALILFNSPAGAVVAASPLPSTQWAVRVVEVDVDNLIDALESAESYKHPEESVLNTVWADPAVTK